MSIIIINSRNPAPKFKFCSVFSAKNPTVNDASYYVVCRGYYVGGDEFWCSAEQQQCATCFLHVSFPSVIPDNV